MNSFDYGNAIRHQATLTLSIIKDVIDADNALVIDCETTGLTGVVIEFSARSVKTGGEVLAFTVNPGEVEWSPYAANLHAPKANLYHRAPETRVFHAALARTLSVWPLVIAYNAPFDTAAIQRTWPSLITSQNGPVVCAMELASALHSEWNPSRNSFTFLGLEKLAQKLNVLDPDEKQQHSASADTALLREVLIALV